MTLSSVDNVPRAIVAKSSKNYNGNFFVGGEPPAPAVAPPLDPANGSSFPVNSNSVFILCTGIYVWKHITQKPDIAKSCGLHHFLAFHVIKECDILKIHNMCLYRGI